MTKAEQLRQVTYRSKFLEYAKQTGNVSATCRHFGISRPKYYKWKKRFDELGAAGLADRPRTPHHSPNATPRSVVSKVLYLRQNYHFGAGRIRDYLKRFHSVRIAGDTVQRILRKHGLGRLPANQKHKPHGKRWQRYEKPLPGHRLQMDVKFLERIPGTKKRLYQFTAIDDCTRIRVLKIYDACNQGTAVAFANEVLRRLPFRVHVVQTDNGAEFQSHFHWHLEQLDIRHVYIQRPSPARGRRAPERASGARPGRRLTLRSPRRARGRQELNACPPSLLRARRVAAEVGGVHRWRTREAPGDALRIQSTRARRGTEIEILGRSTANRGASPTGAAIQTVGLADPPSRPRSYSTSAAARSIVT